MAANEWTANMPEHHLEGYGSNKKSVAQIKSLTKAEIRAQQEAEESESEQESESEDESESESDSDSEEEEEQWDRSLVCKNLDNVYLSELLFDFD